MNPKEKFGTAKPPIQLIPPSFLVQTSKAMELGAVKYGPFNWRGEAVSRMIYYGAALRHILQAIDGEDMDPESGVPHEAHVAACMAIILDAHSIGKLVEDRPAVKGASAELIRRLTRQTGDVKTAAPDDDGQGVPHRVAPPEPRRRAARHRSVPGKGPSTRRSRAPRDSVLKLAAVVATLPEPFNTDTLSTTARVPRKAASNFTCRGAAKGAIKRTAPGQFVRTAKFASLFPTPSTPTANPALALAPARVHIPGLDPVPATLEEQLHKALQERDHALGTNQDKLARILQDKVNKLQAQLNGNQAKP
jgi:hypothetical protein